MSRRSLLHLLIAAIILFACYPAMAENRLALVIGQSAYRSVPALPNPANDPRAMTQLLTDSGFEVLAASNLSQYQLREQASDTAALVATRARMAAATIVPTPRRCSRSRKSRGFRSRKPSSAFASRSTGRPTGDRRRGTAPR